MQETITRDFILTIELTLESIKQTEENNQAFPFWIGRRLLEYYSFTRPLPGKVGPSFYASPLYTLLLSSDFWWKYLV